MPKRFTCGHCFENKLMKYECVHYLELEALMYGLELPRPKLCVDCSEHIEWYLWDRWKDIKAGGLGIKPDKILES